MVIKWAVAEASDADSANDIVSALANTSESHPTSGSLEFLLVAEVDVRPDSFKVIVVRHVLEH